MSKDGAAFLVFGAFRGVCEEGVCHSEGEKSIILDLKYELWWYVGVKRGLVIFEKLRKSQTFDIEDM